MTSEQIENLKGRLDERCVDGEGINVTREDVERLLDEREALLETLKWVQWAGTPVEVAHFNPEACPACAASPDDGHKPDCRLAAALAKAEAP